MATKPKLPKGVDLERSLRAFESACYALAWSPDGSQLAAGFEDGAIRVWDAGTWDEFRRIAVHRDWVRSLSWSPDGRRLASASDDESVGIWEIETGERLHRFKSTSWVLSVAWSPKGRHIAWGDESNVSLRDSSATGERVNLTGHEENAKTVAWSPDASQLASGSKDATVRLWNLASRKTVRRLKGGEQHRQRGLVAQRHPARLRREPNHPHLGDFIRQAGRCARRSFSRGPYRRLFAN